MIDTGPAADPGGVEAAIQPDGTLTWAGRVMRAALGEAGVVLHKEEGDHGTPSGLLPLRRVLYRADRLRAPPRAAVPRELLAPDDGWCDDPSSRDYNCMIRLPHSARHERLWRDDPLYDVVAVLGWNDSPPQRQRGSAIFLHVATPDLAPTAGCVALRLPDLLELLAGGVTRLRVHPPG